MCFYTILLHSFEVNQLILFTHIHIDDNDTTKVPQIYKIQYTKTFVIEKVSYYKYMR